MPARGSCLETLLTSLVGSAAVIVWVNELLGDGWAGVLGIAIVAALAGWVFTRRTCMQGRAVSGKLRRMTTRSYTVLGWLAWQVISRVAKRKIAQNRVKLGAAATVFAVIAAGLLAARASSGD